MRVGVSRNARRSSTSATIGPTRSQMLVTSPMTTMSCGRQAGHDRRQPRAEELRHAFERLDGAPIAALGEPQDVFEPQPRL